MTRAARRFALGTGVLALAAALTVGVAGRSSKSAPPPLPRLDESKLVDLTYPFDSTTLYWSPDETFRLEVVSRGKTSGGYWYASNRFCASEHGGTHMDAPSHFSETGRASDEIPITQLVGPACVVDVSAACAKDPDYRLQVSDLLAWEKAHGRIPNGAIVLMRSGWGSRWPHRLRYFGGERMTDSTSYHFPGFSRETAEFLTQDRHVDAVGLDTPSLDHGPSRDFIAHRVFSAANVPGFENIAHLDRLPARGAAVLAFPIRNRGGTGGPARIVAILP